MLLVSVQIANWVFSKDTLYTYFPDSKIFFTQFVKTKDTISHQSYWYKHLFFLFHEFLCFPIQPIFLHLAYIHLRCHLKCGIIRYLIQTSINFCYLMDLIFFFPQEEYWNEILLPKSQFFFLFFLIRFYFNFLEQQWGTFKIMMNNL